MSTEFLLQLALAGGTAAGIYAAIRADLARAIALAEQAIATASRAHDRIDSLHGKA